MIRNSLLSLTLALALGPLARAQSEAPATLEIDTQNLVIYRHDVFDPSRLATEAGPTSPLPLRSFMNVTWLADVVAVNGTPAKGTMTVRGVFLSLSPNPNPGTAVADIGSAFFSDWAFDILRADSSPLGMILANGWAFGPRVAGFPSLRQGNLAVLGGTGAFLGIRGQGGESSQTDGPRAFASVTEDPSMRRTHGGLARRYSFQLIPMARPDFVKSADGPGVFHSDFSPVTISNPAKKGEVLIAAASGLGPTLPGKQPGAPFPPDGAQEVASPVQVLVNGTAVNALNRIGWPGTTATYRVDFQMPDNTAAGMASVQLVAAWIPGSAIQIPVQ